MGDAITTLLILFGLAAVCFIGAVSYRKKQKHYRENGELMHGTVTAREKCKGWRGNQNWTYYALTVLGDNGTTYRIETDHSAARKYMKRDDVTIYVANEKIMPQMEVFSEEAIEKILENLDSPEERAQMRAELLEENRLAKSINEKSELLAQQAVPPMLKEEQVKAWQIAVLIAFGVCFAGLGILGIVLSIIRG